MSKSCAVEYAGRSIWAYDQSLSILLYVVVDEAVRSSGPTLSAAHIEQLRRVAVVGSDFGLHIDNDWADERPRLIELLSYSADLLRRLERLRGEDVAQWKLIGDDGVIWRESVSADISTEPVVSLTEAVVRLLTGDLAKPPSGHWWAYGFDAEPQLVAMRDADGMSG